MTNPAAEDIKRPPVKPAKHVPMVPAKEKGQFVFSELRYPLIVDISKYGPKGTEGGAKMVHILQGENELDFEEWQQAKQDPRVQVYLDEQKIRESRIVSPGSLNLPGRDKLT